MLDLKTVDALPDTKRSGGGRRSEAREQIKAALLDGKPVLIENVDLGENGRNFNALQQRIRTAGEAIGVKVTVRLHKHDDGTTGDVYFAPKDQADA